VVSRRLRVSLLLPENLPHHDGGAARDGGSSSNDRILQWSLVGFSAKREYLKLTVVRCLPCSSIVAFLFPIFASYKALQASNPAQLTPWLMYWVVLACALLVEGWTEWILVW
jgi:hypothetical protein